MSFIEKLRKTFHRENATEKMVREYRDVVSKESPDEFCSTYDHKIHYGWGNHIEWFFEDFEDVDWENKVFKVYGHVPSIPEVGQTLIGDFKRSYLKFVFVNVRRENNPPDMFFWRCHGYRPIGKGQRGCRNERRFERILRDHETEVPEKRPITGDARIDRLPPDRARTGQARRGRGE